MAKIIVKTIKSNTLSIFYVFKRINMKTVVLIRHGKSSWKHDVSDKERPLKNRGISDAKLIAQNFRESKFEPDLVISSPANRALSTCKIFLQILDISDKRLNISDKIYDFSGQNVIDFIKELDNDYQKIMIFGHNHAFTAIANFFGDIRIDNVPTSGLVMLTFNVDNWKDIDLGKTELILFPKDIR